MGAELVGDIRGQPAEPGEYWLDELHVMFTGRLGGNRITSRLRIGVERASDKGAGRFTVQSELAFPDHLNLVKRLIEVTEDA